MDFTCPWPGRIGHGRHHDSGRSMPQHMFAMSTGCQGNGDGAVQDHSAASLGLLQRLDRWWWGLSRNYTKTSVLESAGVSDGHWKWDEHLRRLQGSPKVAGGALMSSVGGMSVRHMSATQSGGCSGLKVVSKVVHVLLFVLALYWFCLYCLCVCLCKHCWTHIYLQGAAWGRHGKKWNIHELTIVSFQKHKPRTRISKHWLIVSHSYSHCFPLFLMSFSLFLIVSRFDPQLLMFSQNKNVPSILVFVKCCDLLLIAAFSCQKVVSTLQCLWCVILRNTSRTLWTPQKKKQTTENNCNKLHKPSVFGKQETSQFPSWSFWIGQFLGRKCMFCGV